MTQFPLEVKQDVSLKTLNTFGLPVKAAQYVRFSQIEQIPLLIEMVSFDQQPFLILGGGSNLLFLDDYPGLVIKNDLKGISIERQNQSHVYLKAMAGENWEKFVEYCVEHGWGGLENLTLIPGNVGTGPMQNIGAYGVELKDTFHSLEALDIASGQIKTFYGEDCRFGYRESYFKKEGKGKFIILSVVFKLTRKDHDLKTSYGPVQKELQELKTSQVGIKDVMTAINRIRRSKLPDPQVLGNAGSFFKNPVLPQQQFQQLAERYPDIPGYQTQSTMVKTSAAWLIDQLGWKGYRQGDAGVHKKQALVLVNYGNAKGSEIMDLAYNIQKSVFENYGINLEPEVNIVGKTNYLD